MIIAVERPHIQFPDGLYMPGYQTLQKSSNDQTNMSSSASPRKEAALYKSISKYDLFKFCRSILMLYALKDRVGDIHVGNLNIRDSI